MLIIQTILVLSFVFVMLSPDTSRGKIIDFSSDNFLFHPFVQQIRNYRSKDYLIKLLKRNLEQKLRKNRKPCEDTFEPKDRHDEKLEKSKCACNCKCNERNFRKRDSFRSTRFKNFVCETEGSFANPASCRKFYICFRNEPHPIPVRCPKGFAFDAAGGKCSRKAARDCIKKQMAIYK